MWMLLAADAGDPAASANKAIVARWLSRREIEDAEDLSRQWHARTLARDEPRAA
jgi:hypothetical protein